MDLLRYASVTEILQLLTAVLGVGLAMYAVWENVTSAVNLSDTPPEGLQRLVALGNVRRELARTVAQGLLMIIGIVSVLLPPPDAGVLVAGVAPEVTQAVIVRIGLVMVTATLALDSYMERRLNATFLGRVKILKRTTAKDEHPESA